MMSLAGAFAQRNSDRPQCVRGRSFEAGTAHSSAAKPAE
jgi:hypothetical protein